MGTIRPRARSPHEKILTICNQIKDIISEHGPAYAALEKVFYHKNVQTLIRSSELRGAIILALLESKITIKEYTPTEIKLTATGNGRASKAQIRYFMERIIKEKKNRASNHAVDAIAIAYTATQKMRRAL
jgi:crossover junction endodeoxyribonuclease RuvC